LAQQWRKSITGLHGLEKAGPKSRRQTLHGSKLDPMVFMLCSDTLHKRRPCHVLFRGRDRRDFSRTPKTPRTKRRTLHLQKRKRGTYHKDAWKKLFEQHLPYVGVAQTQRPKSYGAGENVTACYATISSAMLAKRRSTVHKC